MRKSACLILIAAAGVMLSAHAQTSAELTDADWLSAAKAALALTKPSEGVTVVVDDSISPEARKALQSLRTVVPIADMPDQSGAVPAPGNTMRIFQFHQQGERIEVLEGAVYPRIYQAGDCRLMTQLFLARAADGEWRQDGPVQVRFCTRH